MTQQYTAFLINSIQTTIKYHSTMSVSKPHLEQKIGGSIVQLSSLQTELLDGK